MDDRPIGPGGGDELVAAPHTSLNAPIGTHRRLATIGTPLAELKELRLALGGTVNDVVLTAVSGGLRALLLARGEQPPEGGLRAMVPVNVRPAGERVDHRAGRELRGAEPHGADERGGEGGGEHDEARGRRPARGGPGHSA